MATYRKRGDNWQAIVDRKGIYKSQSFPTKAHAVAWATSIEAEIIAGKINPTIAHGQNKTIGNMLKKYSEEVSVTKSGSKWEQIRIHSS